MTLAYVVYFGLMAALVVLWTMPAMRVAGTNTVVSRMATPATLISIAIFTVIIGGRYNVGGDYFGYLDYYRYSSNSSSLGDVSLEFGFLFIVNTLKLLSLPDRSIIFATSFIQIALLSLWMRKNPQVAPFVAFVFVALLLLDMNNIIRQGIAFLAILMAIFELNRRNWIGFFSYIALGYMFHRSALIILPIGPLILIAPMISRRWQFALLAFSYATTNIFVDQVINLFTIFSPLIGYAGYSDVTRADLFFSNQINPSFNLGVYLWLFVDVVIISFSRRISEVYEGHGYRLYHYLFLVAALLQPVANAWDFLPFARALFYFVCMRAVCAGYMLRYCFVDARKPGPFVLAAGVSVVFIAWLAIAISRGAAWSAPYQFS